MDDEHVRERGELDPSDGVGLPTPCFALVFQGLLPHLPKEEVKAHLQLDWGICRLRRICGTIAFRNFRRWDTEAQDVHVVDTIPDPITSQTLQTLFQSKRKDIRRLTLSCDVAMGPRWSSNTDERLPGAPPLA